MHYAFSSSLDTYEKERGETIQRDREGEKQRTSDRGMRTVCNHTGKAILHPKPQNLNPKPYNPYPKLQTHSKTVARTP